MEAPGRVRPEARALPRVEVVGEMGIQVAKSYLPPSIVGRKSEGMDHSQD
jgi:hypothetical protein